MVTSKKGRYFCGLNLQKYLIKQIYNLIFIEFKRAKIAARKAVLDLSILKLVEMFVMLVRWKSNFEGDCDYENISENLTFGSFRIGRISRIIY